MKKRSEIYDRAFKDNAVRLSYRVKSIRKLERDLFLKQGSLARWRNKHEKSRAESFQAQSNLNLNSERRNIGQLEKKINQLNLKFEILKNGRWFITQGKVMVFYFIKSHEKIYPIMTMCQVLGVNEGTYRKWKNNFVSEKKSYKILIQKEITTIFFEAMGRYGYPRITIELHNRGYKICKSTVSTYMRELGIHSKS